MYFWKENIRSSELDVHLGSKNLLGVKKDPPQELSVIQTARGIKNWIKVVF